MNFLKWELFPGSPGCKKYYPDLKFISFYKIRVRPEVVPYMCNTTVNEAYLNFAIATFLIALQVQNRQEIRNVCSFDKNYVNACSTSHNFRYCSGARN